MLSRLCMDPAELEGVQLVGVRSSEWSFKTTHALPIWPWHGCNDCMLVGGEAVNGPSRYHTCIAQLAMAWLQCLHACGWGKQ